MRSVRLFAKLSKQDDNIRKIKFNRTAGILIRTELNRLKKFAVACNQSGLSIVCLANKFI